MRNSKLDKIRLSIQIRQVLPNIFYDNNIILFSRDIDNYLIEQHKVLIYIKIMKFTNFINQNHV